MLWARPRLLAINRSVSVENSSNVIFFRIFSFILYQIPGQTIYIRAWGSFDFPVAVLLSTSG
jgi:hypothetical protein